MSEEIDSQPELTAISSLVFWEVERKWDEIARYIAEGCGEPQFLAVLRRLLDPNASLHDIDLVVCRPEGRPQSPKPDKEAHVLIKLLRSRRRERRGLDLIACEIVANGLADEKLRHDLAGMFSRQGEGPLGMWFDVLKLGRGKPRRFAKLQAQNFLELHADTFNEKTTHVVSAAAVLFGLSEDTAKHYLKERRRFRRRDAVNWYPEFDRAVAYSMREAGHPEYQPLSVIMNNRDL